jgi:hypothetical protein
MSRESARRLLREASLELARLRRIRGASHRTWRRIARARKRIALATALLAAAPLAEPAAAADPLFQPRFSFDNQLRVWASPAFVDIDGDGDLDAFTGDRYGRTFFLRNNGTATDPDFANRAAAFGITDVGFRSVPTLADIDADGDADALVGNAAGAAVLFSNTGTASAPAFAAGQTNALGLADIGDYSAPAFADLDGDGDFDVLASDGADGSLAFFANTGTASAPAFAGPATNPFGLSSLSNSPRRPDPVDIDGDGDLDLLVTLFGGPTIFFQNTGTASSPAFAAPVINPFGLEREDELEASAGFADLDGDGDLDAFLLTGDFEGYYYTTVYENVGTASQPVFTLGGNAFGLGADFFAFSSELTDIDGDGDLDAFVSSQYSALHFFRNTGAANAPAFGRDPANPWALAGNDPLLADIDADGDLDAFIGVDSGETVFYENTGSAGTAAFAAPQANAFGLGAVAAYAAPDLADLDDDGDLDALIGSGTGESIYFANTGSAGAPAFAAAASSPFGLADVGTYASPDLADLDGDGDLDALIGAADGHLLFFANTGTAAAPAFAAPVSDPFGLPDVSRYASPELLDFDGDGDLDALLGNGVFWVEAFENTGTATAPAFAAVYPPSPLGFTSLRGYLAPAAGDLDGDGDLDVLVGNVGSVVLFRNTGTASAPAFVSALAPNGFGLTYREPDLVDIDGDGDLDAFGNTGGFLLFWENTGSASEPAFSTPVTHPFGLPSMGFFGAPDFADLDDDGDLDALVGSGGLFFFENTGSVTVPAFAAALTNPFGLTDLGGLHSPELADVDGDGDLDAFVGVDYSDSGAIAFFRNTGTASAPAFAAPVTSAFGLVGGLTAPYASGPASPELADVDGDGDLDLFVAGSGKLFFFENVLLDPDACSDGLDNDGDGRIDLGPDAGCASAADTSELSALQCDNGLDDDGDGKIDWRGDGTGDPHCSGLLDGTELPPPPGPGCGIGPELLLLGPLLAAVRRRRGSYTAPSCPSPTPTSSSSADR